MGDIHELVIRHGHRAARDMVGPERRLLVDIAAEVLADAAQRIGITYSGFCLTGFPHKKLPDDMPWEKTGHNVTLLVEPGRLKVGPGPAVLVGVPYGRRARIIMIYLQTQAIRKGSTQVELGHPGGPRAGRGRPRHARPDDQDGGRVSRGTCKGASGSRPWHPCVPSEFL